MSKTINKIWINIINSLAANWVSMETVLVIVKVYLKILKVELTLPNEIKVGATLIL